MRLNADFSQAVIITPELRQSSPSPAPGVERFMLDRIGDEVARATTIVRFAPDKFFPEHRHDGGEEYLVLEGVFSDQYGDFPAGTYVRNPVGTSHSPHTVSGCTIFVKLWQFDPGDQTQLAIDTTKADWKPGSIPGQTVLDLHSFGSEVVKMERWQKGSKITRQAPTGGMEFLLLSGELQKSGETGDIYPAGTWFRFPEGTELGFDCLEDTAFFCKSDHLSQRIEAPAV
ncbi:cupin domain-containing protein [Kiloniella laminariae]|uniref:Cupin domain-containing protein n=1 Tax=Kiloniella laminariae TaxID=454162 RepID=A0ABT4LNU3_9PROT|nr:cupin domain-containing protein [Kiloniella laminariae]MCZ4282752.1 cupin domain-containing protein [Kiloniella laminariae]